MTIAEPREMLPSARPALAVILLVEDEELVRNVTCEVLETAGYSVLTAKNAAEATEVFDRYSRLIGLVITDVVMPGQDGRTLAEQLRARCPGLRVIVSSGYPEGTMVGTDFAEGDRVLFLPKPFSADTLLRNISRLLTRQAECPQAIEVACGR
jgi:CheY-like chemotaxis protein